MPLAISAKAASKRKAKDKKPQPGGGGGGGKQRKVDLELDLLNMKRQLMLTVRGVVEKVEEWQEHVLEQLESTSGKEMQELFEIRTLIYQRFMALQKFVPSKFSSGHPNHEIAHRWQKATAEFQDFGKAPSSPNTEKIVAAAFQWTNQDPGDPQPRPQPESIEKDLAKKFAEKFKAAVTSVASASTSLTAAVEELQDFAEAKAKQKQTAPLEAGEAAEEIAAAGAEGDSLPDKDAEDEDDDDEDKDRNDGDERDKETEQEERPVTDRDRKGADDNHSDSDRDEVEDSKEGQGRNEDRTRTRNHSTLMESILGSFDGATEGGSILQEFPSFNAKNENTAFVGGWGDELIINSEIENDKFLVDLLNEYSVPCEERRTKTYPNFTKAGSGRGSGLGTSRLKIHQKGCESIWVTLLNFALHLAA